MRGYCLMTKVAFIGMGYVGLTTSLAFDSKGFSVRYFDIDSDKMEKIKNHKTYIFESGIDVLMGKHKMEPMKDVQDIGDADWIFICVGTPEKEDGHADTKYVFDVISQISKLPKSNYKIVLKSTCPPGTSEKCIRMIEDLTGWKNGIDFVFYFSPEFLREGTALKDTFNPDKIVIGTVSGRHWSLESLYHKVLDKYSTVINTNYVNAEIVKYANNAFLATKISFINQIAVLCECYPGADVYKIADAIGEDNRIGRAFLNAGIGFGGSCFPKDVTELNTTLIDNELPNYMIEATLQMNDAQGNWAVSILRNYHYKQFFEKHSYKPKVVVLGIAFKPNTDDIRYSKGVEVIEQLRKEGIHVEYYDPVAIFDDGQSKIVNSEDCLKNADAAIICTEWEEFKQIKPEDFKYKMRTPIVIDGRRIYDPIAMIKAGIKYYGVGFGNYD